MAATWTWIGTSDDPSVATNWTLTAGTSGSSFPQAGDTAIFPGGTTVPPLFTNALFSDANFELINNATVLVSNTGSDPTTTGIDASSTIDAAGTATTLTIAGPFTNAGTIDVTGTQDSLTIQLTPGSAAVGMLVNIGQIVVGQGDTLAITGGTLESATGITVNGAAQITSTLAGLDNFAIGTGGSLELNQAGTSAPIEVTFTGTSGEIRLDTPTTFAGGINDFALGDTLDLGMFNASTAIFDGAGDITIIGTNGTFTASDQTSSPLNAFDSQGTFTLSGTGGLAGNLKVTEGSGGDTVITALPPSTWQWENVTSSWSLVGGPGNGWDQPQSGDTAIITAGTVSGGTHLSLVGNTIELGGTGGTVAAFFAAGDTSTTASNPSIDSNSVIDSAVPDVSAPETSVLSAGGIFINEGLIDADGPAGSSFTIEISGTTPSGGTFQPGYFINYNQIEVGLDNSMTITVAGTSELLNASVIQVNGGTLDISVSSGAIAGGYAPGTGVIVIGGGGTVITNVSYASNISGVLPVYAFADATTGNTLKIENVLSFGGEIFGFGANDTIDLGSSFAVGTVVYNSTSGILELESATGSIEASVQLASGHFLSAGTQVGTFAVSGTVAGPFNVLTGADGDIILTTGVANDYTTNTSGAWQSTGVWAGGSLPGTLDTVLLGDGAKTPFTLTTGSSPVTVGALALTSDPTLLQITSNTTVSPYPIRLFGGTLEVTGARTLTASAISQSGGTLQLDSGSVLDLTGSPVDGVSPLYNIVPANNGTISVSNSGTAALELGSGTVLITGGTLNAGTSQAGGDGGAIHIGYEGSGTPASLTVQNSGTHAGVVTDTYALVGSDPTSFGVLTLDGNVTWTDQIDPHDTVETRGFMVVGYNGQDNNTGLTPPFSGTATLAVENGATLNEQSYAVIGDNSNSAGSVLVSDGLWNIGTANGGYLVVGLSGEGTLLVTNNGTVAVSHGGTFSLNGSTFANSGISLGSSVGGSGSLTVSGAGALVTDKAGMSVGGGGTGDVQILNGGSILLTGTNGISIGVSNGASGTILVSGTDFSSGAPALLSMGSTTKGITAGADGQGLLDVESGGTIVLNGTGGIAIGQSIDGSGLIIVNGPDALITLGTATSGIGIAQAGTTSGTLLVENGGTILMNGTGGISDGAFAGRNGLIIIDGPNALIDEGTASTGIGVGTSGSGTLEIENGGTFALQATGTSAGIGVAQSTGSSGLIVVTGTSSLLTQNTPNAGLSVGGSGNGMLTVQSGGVVTIAGYGLNIATGSGGSGTVSVSGAGSSIVLSGSNGAASVGATGNGVLNINSGGSVSAATGVYIAENSGTATGAVTVNAGTLTDAGQLSVGFEGSGTLTVDNSGQVQVTGTTGVSVGGFFPPNGGGSGTLVINGGTLSDAGSISVGATNASGVLIVEGGGLLNTSIAAGSFSGIAGEINASGTGQASAIVSGGTWNVNGELNVGDSGSGSLDINSNGLVDVTGFNGIGIGNQAGAAGTVSVESGGTLVASSLSGLNLAYVFSGTASGVLNVGDGGTALFGGIREGGGGTITVGGTSHSALLSSSNYIVVGQSGTGAALIVNELGTVTYATLSIGDSGSSTVTVDAGTLTGGSFSLSNGVLTVEGGGLMSATSGSDSGGSIVVNGGTLSDAGGFSVDAFSSSATVLVEGGGTLITGNSTAVSDIYGSGTAQAAVTVSDGIWTSNGQIIVGDNGSAGSLDINGNGVVNAGTNSISIGNDAGATGVISVESGGRLIGGNLNIANTFTGTATGVLTVGDGGTVEVGNLTESGGGTITVGGTAHSALLTASGGVTIGQSGTGAALTINQFGTLTDSSMFSPLQIGSSVGSSGTVTVNGGTLTTDGLGVGGTGTGTLVVENGGLVFDNGGNNASSVGSGFGSSVTIISTPSLTTLVNFNGTDGSSPYGGLVTDAAGDLFGTTDGGGANGDGTVFEIAKTAGIYASTPTTLVSFNNTNGNGPIAGLITDAAGDLFGSTSAGGANGDGTVFEIAKTAGIYASTPTTLVSFNNTNGNYPEGSLATDAAGDLFGTTYEGGANGDGAVFEIAKTAGIYASAPTTLVNFNGTDGTSPVAGLITDAAGDLFGTTYGGGTNGDGTVYEVANTGGTYASTPTTLVSFNNADGANPYASLAADAAGDLFGTTYGGGANGYGTVFEIAKTGGSYASTPITLASFNGTDGTSPFAGLIIDAAGDLFGTTAGGGANGDGTAFEIANIGGTYASTPTILASFNGTNGAYPYGNLAADAAGNLFGATSAGGANGGGTVFELTGINQGPTVESTSGSGSLVINGGTLNETGTSFTVGGTNTAGTLLVENGGLLNTSATGGSFSGLAGEINASGTGQATAIVSGGTWNVNGQLNVGDTGTGSLDINSDGVVNAGANGISIGNQGGGAGTVSVLTGGLLLAGALSLDNSFSGNATGSLDVAGGTVSVSSLSLGTNGVVTVSSGSLSVSGNTTIGNNNGTGAVLSVTGGDVTLGSVNVAFNPGSSGTVTVSGGTLETTGLLNIGDSGSGVVTVDAGGTLIATDGLQVDQFFSTTGTLVVNGGSVSVSNGLSVGNGGTASVIVEAGGTLTATGTNSVNIGNSSGGTASVTVNDGVFSVSGAPLFIGSGGNGALLVENGGTVTDTYSGFGPSVDINSAGNFQESANVTVTGAGSALNVSAAGTQLIVGDNGSGSLTISAGGMVNVGTNFVDIGNQIGGNGTVAVNSGGDLVTNGMNVGSNGAGTLSMSGGTIADSSGLTIGAGTGASGSATLSGGAIVSADGLTVGSSGVGTLTLNGGTITDTGTYTFAGSNTGGEGTIAISGTGAVLNSNAFIISNSGVGVGSVDNGGVVNAVSLSVGQFFDGSLTIQGGTVTTTGTAPGDDVGNATGSDGTLSVSGGGILTDAAGLTFGINSGATGAGTVGSGTITVGGNVVIGNSGLGTLTVNGGGTILANGTYDGVGQNSGSFGELVINSGGQFVSAATSMAVGSNAGSSGDLIINAGGTLLFTEPAQDFTQALRIGASGASGTLAAAQGNVLVTGIGALLNAGNNALAVGNGGVGNLTVSSGGSVVVGTPDSSVFYALGIANNGGTGAVTVTGAGSTLTVNGYLLDGRGGAGALTVENSGKVVVNDAPLDNSGIGIGAGRSAGPSSPSNFGGDGVALVTSGGVLDETSTVSGMTVGGDGVDGALTVNNGGTVLVGGGLTVGTATEASGTIYGGAGELTIGAGGTVLVNNPVAANGYDITIGNANSSIGATLTGTATGEASGEATVSGPGALLNANGFGIAVGWLSSGDLTISQGATVLSGTTSESLNQALSIGRRADGSVTITDPGSVFRTTGGVYAGRAGSGSLTIENQASLIAGLDPNNVTGISIGGTGFGLGITNGVTYLATGGSGTGLITSGGYMFSQMWLKVGTDGTDGTLTVNQGGTAEAATQIIVGDSTPVAGGDTLITPTAIYVTNTSTLITTAGALDIGPGGLVKSDGPHVAGTPSVIVGAGAGASGTVNVTGGGLAPVLVSSIFGGGPPVVNPAVLSTGGDPLMVGQFGEGSVLVSQGGTVQAGTTFAHDEAITLGGSVGSTGGLTVTDDGSLVQAVGQVDVGGAGAGSLLVENGATAVTGGNAVDANEGFDVAASAGSSGSATVSSDASLTNTGTFVVGDAGVGALNIQSGGLVITSPGTTGAAAVVANQASSGGSSVNVSGVGSDWQIAGTLVVGNAASGALNISSGGTVTASSLDTAAQSTGDGVISVTGTGSSLTLTGSLTLGDQAAGELSILGGATVSAQALTVGNANAASSGNVDVEGAGSTLHIATGGVLNVGYAGGGSGELTIGQGSTLQFSGGVVEAGRASYNNNGGVIDPDSIEFTTASNAGLGENDYNLYVGNINAVQVTSGTGTWDTPMVLTGTSVSDATNNIQNNGDIGEWQLSNSGTLIVNANTVDSGQAIIFEDATDTLVIGQVVNGGSAGIAGVTPTIAAGAENLLAAGGFAAEIWGYQSGDRIEFNNLVVNSDSIVGGNTLDLFGNGGTLLGSLVFLTKAGNHALGSTAMNAAAAQIECFAAGTRIRTTRGEVKVEALREGDVAITGIDGSEAPVVWIGHREVDCARHPDPRSVWPVRIRAGAFGRGLPKRALTLSPDHAVYVNEVLVPVKHLINGTTIAQVKVDRVTYYHVELDRHDVLIADGLPAESYLDVGDRANFANGGPVVRLHIDLAHHWEAGGCAPLVIYGEELERVKAVVAVEESTVAVRAACERLVRKLPRRAKGGPYGVPMRSIN